jgi:opacity protein-like surface antigen
MTNPSPLHLAALVVAFAFAPVLVVHVGAQQTQDAASQPPRGWRTTIYPIYGWLPVFGADIRLPVIPNPPPCDGCGDGGPIVPGGSVSSSLNGAAFAAVLVENEWIQGEVNVLWAGMSADKERPNLEVDVETVLGAARLGVRVVPDLFAYGGARRIALDVKATALVFDEVQWKPGIWEGVVGAAYTPYLSSRWRLLIHGDYGGVGAENHSTYTANASVEWHPMSHLAINLGYGYFRITVDGAVRNKPVRLDQTLHGPIVGVGIPF